VENCPAAKPGSNFVERNAMTDHLEKAIKFGAQLLDTGDLDPVYIALHEANLNSSLRKRILLAYTCLYHLGCAAAIGSAPDFWKALMTAAKSREWPRGTERRHWRGENSISCVEYLQTNFKHPESVVDYWADGTLSFGAVSDRVQSIPQYGPWIAFKVADLLERVMEVPVNFDDCELGIYSEPRKGAGLILHGDPNRKKVNEGDLRYVCNLIRLDPRLKSFKAPPSFNRKINIQEVETILCKYKSHFNGHYPPGKDTLEIIHALSSRPWGRTAQKLLARVRPLERHWS
jgi:hypothetical protein